MEDCLEDTGLAITKNRNNHNIRITSEIGSIQEYKFTLVNKIICSISVLPFDNQELKTGADCL